MTSRIKNMIRNHSNEYDSSNTNDNTNDDNNSNNNKNNNNNNKVDNLNINGNSCKKNHTNNVNDNDNDDGDNDDEDDENDDKNTYYGVTMSTCISWSRDTNGGNNGRYKHLIQIHECEKLEETKKQLIAQREATNEVHSFDEKHRLTPVYEFIVASRNRYDRYDNRETTTTTNDERNDCDIGNVRITGATRKPKAIIRNEEITKTLRIVSVPVYDPSIRRTCAKLQKNSKVHTAFVVLISDSDIRNWTNALQDYFVPYEDHIDHKNNRTTSQNRPNNNRNNNNNKKNNNNNRTNTSDTKTIRNSIETNAINVEHNTDNDNNNSSSKNNTQTNSNHFINTTDKNNNTNNPRASKEEGDTSTTPQDIPNSTELDLRDSCEYIKFRIHAIR